MNNTQVRKNDNDSKKIVTMLVLVFTLMFCTTGATYAYLAFSATNNVATGNVAAAGLTLTVAEQTLGGTDSGTKTNVMVPQNSENNLLNTVMGNSWKCVDDYGNTVCKVYKINVSTTSTATTPTIGTIAFTTPTTNLYWRLASGATSLGSVGTNTKATTSAAQFATPTFTASTKSFEYYIVIWIEETGSEQNDSGSWRATIAFNTTNGTGITSTITS